MPSCIDEVMDSLEQTRARTTSHFRNANLTLPDRGSTQQGIIPGYHPSGQSHFQEATVWNQNNLSIVQQNMSQEERYQHLFQILNAAIQIIAENDLQNDHDKRDGGSSIQEGEGNHSNDRDDVAGNDDASFS